MQEYYRTGAKAGQPRLNQLLVCPGCGGKKERRAKICRTCTGARPLPFVACKGCGKQFKPKHRDRMQYCTRQCAYEHAHQWSHKVTDDLQARKARPIEAKRLKLSKDLAELVKDKPSTYRSVWFRSCRTCDKPYVARNKRGWYCCESCKNPPLIMESRACQTCAAEFETTQKSQKKYCTASCIPDTKHFKARALKAGVPYHAVSPFKVFERDGWRCQICGKSTPKTQRGKHKHNSPELDHRIPLALNGPHHYDNVQCACRQCNGEKNSHVILGQLPMFGIV